MDEFDRLQYSKKEQLEDREVGKLWYIYLLLRRQRGTEQNGTLQLLME